MWRAISVSTFVLLALAVPTAHAQELTIPEKMCDAGVFSIGGTLYSFEDIAVEGNAAVSLNDIGQVVAYGYLADIDLGVEVNSRINAVISTIDICYARIGVVQIDTNLQIDVVLTRDDFSDEEWKNVRRNMIRLRENILNANALVRLTGGFGIFSNTFDLFYQAKTIEVLATFP